MTTTLSKGLFVYNFIIKGGAIVGKRKKKSPFYKYYLKDGTLKWGVNDYWGIDPRTGEEVRIRKRSFDTRAAAKVYRDREAERLNNSLTQSKTEFITFADLYKDYLDFMLEAGYAESTYAIRKNVCDNHVIPELGKYYVHTITIDECQKMVNKIKTKRKDYRIVAGYVRQIFKYAINKGYVKDNPIDGVIFKGGKEKFESRQIDSRENYYSPEDLMKFLDYYRENGRTVEYVYWRLLAFTGLRRGEALAIYKSDINHNNQSIKINKTLTTDKNHKTLLSHYTKTDDRDSKETEHVVYLDDTTYNLIADFAENKLPIKGPNLYYTSDSKYLFTSPHTGTHYSHQVPNRWIRDFWIKHRDELEKLDLKYISPHGFRHSQATLLHELGIDPKDAQHRLRHKNLETTMDVYTHITENREQETADKLNDFESSRTKSRTKVVNLSDYIS